MTSSLSTSTLTTPSNIDAPSSSSFSFLSNFNIISLLGKGSYGCVYKVTRNNNDNTIYALKQVPFTNLKPKEKQNSLNEIRILASIHSKNIIQYKESFYDKETNSLCIVMEYAEYGDLNTKIRAMSKSNTYFTEYEILSITIQVIKGLYALHKRNILHRDIKSANIFLFNNGTVKIGDLNVSTVMKNQLRNTQTGTPYYASPEIWDNKPYDYKSDIWSLGCLLYEITCLKAPFRGSSLKKIYQAIKEGKYDAIPRMYSNTLAGLVYMCLQSDAQKRPSCEELLKLIVDKRRGFKVSEGDIEKLGLNVCDSVNGSNGMEKDDIYGSLYMDEREDWSNNSCKWDSYCGKLMDTIKMPKRVSDINGVLPKSRYKSLNVSAMPIMLVNNVKSHNECCNVVNATNNVNVTNNVNKPKRKLPKLYISDVHSFYAPSNNNNKNNINAVSESNNSIPFTKIIPSLKQIHSETNILNSNSNNNNNGSRSSHKKHSININNNNKFNNMNYQIQTTQDNIDEIKEDIQVLTSSNSFTNIPKETSHNGNNNNNNNTPPTLNRSLLNNQSKPPQQNQIITATTPQQQQQPTHKIIITHETNYSLFNRPINIKRKNIKDTNTTTNTNTNKPISNITSSESKNTLTEFQENISKINQIIREQSPHKYEDTKDMSFNLQTIPHQYKHKEIIINNNNTHQQRAVSVKQPYRNYSFISKKEGMTPLKEAKTIEQSKSNQNVIRNRIVRLNRPRSQMLGNYNNKNKESRNGWCCCNNNNNNNNNIRSNMIVNNSMLPTIDKELSLQYRHNDNNNNNINSHVSHINNIRNIQREKDKHVDIQRLTNNHNSNSNNYNFKQNYFNPIKVNPIYFGKDIISSNSIPIPFPNTDNTTKHNNINNNNIKPPMDKILRGFKIIKQE